MWGGEGREAFSTQSGLIVPSFCYIVLQLNVFPLDDLQTKATCSECTAGINEMATFIHFNTHCQVSGRRGMFQKASCREMQRVPSTIGRLILPLPALQLLTPKYVSSKSGPTVLDARVAVRMGSTLSSGAFVGTFCGPKWANAWAKVAVAVRSKPAVSCSPEMLAFSLPGGRSPILLIGPRASARLEGGPIPANRNIIQAEWQIQQNPCRGAQPHHHSGACLMARIFLRASI